MPRISIRQALVGLIAGSLLVGLVPAGLALDRRLEMELERRSRADLAMAPKVLADRLATESDALMMRAKDLAGSATPVDAATGSDRDDALARIEEVRLPSGEELLLVGSDGRPLTDFAAPAGLVEATREGEMPVAFDLIDGRLWRVALAPVARNGEWLGAAGVATAVGKQTAGVLAGLTRTDVLLLGPGGRPVASTIDSTTAPRIVSLAVDSAGKWPGDGEVRRLTVPGGSSYWAVTAPLGGGASAVFLRNVEAELAVLPGLRRSAAIAALLALAIALLLGVVFAGRLARPVQSLAEASRRLAGGEFEAPVPDSRVREIDRVGTAFRDMRDALADKIDELTRANEELEDRQRRLQALQSEVLQRDRLATSGRLITELAHEIRNPVAGVLNCLELIHRRLEPESELREFSSMGIDELLRMHRLAEKMLDANRPLDPEADRCDPAKVSRLVADLAAVGSGPPIRLEDAATDDASVDGEATGGDGRPEAAIGPDALKQILLNLVENAREATAGVGGDGDEIVIRLHRSNGEETGGPGVVAIEVLDRGPGVDTEIRDRVFDPFFTTKEAVHGVGLGLFVAEGLARRHGGRLLALDREGGGARFRLEVPEA